MKKTFTLIICAVLLMTACLSLTACSSNSSGTKNPIDFGKKYMLDEDTYYIFNSDHTGIFEDKYFNEYVMTTTSGWIKFEWREASNGAVYMFEVERHYNEDHTAEDDYLRITKIPIYFSEDFLTYSFDATTVFYIKEGSELEKILED